MLTIVKSFILTSVLFSAFSLNAQKTTATQFTWGNFFNVLFGNDLDWNNPGTWDNGVPADGDTVIITLPTEFNITDQSLGGLRVSSSLTINTGNLLSTNYLVLESSLEVNGDFHLSADQVGEGRILSHDGGGSINGTFTSEYIIDRCNNWSVYGGPFDASFNDYAAASGGNMIYTGFPGSDYPAFGYVNAYLVDEDWSNGFDGYLVPNSANQVIPRGEGFWYWNSDTVYNSNSNNSIPQQWKVSTSGTLDFTQPFNFNVSFTNNGFIDYDGWNLLSNPYPGTIDWDAAAWNSSNITGEIHYFNTCGQAYSSYVGGVGVNGGTRYVSPYQGFYVKANGGSPTLSCDASVIASDFVQLRSQPSHVLKIAFQHDEIAIRLSPNADEGFNNNLDASKFFNNSTLYSTADLTSDHAFAINALSNDDTIVVPVYVKGGQDTLHFSNINSFHDYRIYVDNLEEIDLSTDPLNADRMSYWPEITAANNTYVLDSSSNDFTHRINVWLVKQPQDFSSTNDLANDELSYQLISLENAMVLELNNPATERLTVEVFDISGRVIETSTIEKGSSICKIKRPQQVKIIQLKGVRYQQVIKAF